MIHVQPNISLMNITLQAAAITNGMGTYVARGIARLIILLTIATLSTQQAWAQAYDDYSDYDEDDEEEDDLMESFRVALTEANATYYMAQVTTDLNLRSGRGTEYDVITTIPKGSYVFLTSVDANYKFRNVLDVENDLYGYVSAAYLRNFRKVNVDENGQLQIDAPNYKAYADVVVTNETNRHVTISIGGVTKKFAPQEIRTFSDMCPGRYKVMATSPGVRPYVGYDRLEGGYQYSWTFYISTVYR